MPGCGGTPDEPAAFGGGVGACKATGQCKRAAAASSALRGSALGTSLTNGCRANSRKPARTANSAEAKRARKTRREISIRPYAPFLPSFSCLCVRILRTFVVELVPFRFGAQQHEHTTSRRSRRRSDGGRGSNWTGRRCASLRSSCIARWICCFALVSAQRCLCNSRCRLRCHLLSIGVR